MTTEVSWRVELVANDLDAFLALTAEMVEFTKTESGVLSYQRFIIDGVVHVYERYIDSEAALAHLRSFKERFAARFSGLVSRQQFDVYGTPTAELREVLTSFGATRFFEPFGGLAYWC